MAGPALAQIGRPSKSRAAALSIASNSSLILLKVVAGTITVTFFVSASLHRRARETESVALEADATHLRTDMATSFGVLVGLTLVSVTGADWLDPAVALLIAAAIVREGYKILNRSSRVLVDEALPVEELEAIGAEVRAFGPPGVAGFHKLRARRAG